MRALLTILLSTLIILSATAQPRQNRTTLTFLSQSPKLTQATGWIFNDDTGEWVDNPNAISTSKEMYFSDPNFAWIRFATIKYKGEKLYVLLYEKNEKKYSGGYKPIETTFLVIDSTTYRAMKASVTANNQTSLDFSGIVSGKMNTLYEDLGTEYTYGDEYLLRLINKTLEEENGRGQCFFTNSQTTNGQKILRFNLIDYCFHAPDFSKSYFETTQTEFLKLFWE